MLCSPSADDAFDLELGVILPMALMLLVVLAPAHLENGDLFAPPVADDRRLDRGARDNGLTEANAVAVADHQDLVENDFCTHVGGQLFHLELLAGGDLVLL